LPSNNNNNNNNNNSDDDDDFAMPAVHAAPIVASVLSPDASLPQGPAHQRVAAATHAVPRTNNQRSPSVRFSDNITYIHFVPCLQQLLPNDTASSLYYTSADLNTVKVNLRSSAKLFRRATNCGATLEDFTSHEDTSRGIEHLLSKATLLSLQAEQERCVRVPLALQDSGASPEQIALVTSVATRGAVDRAVRKAVEDEAFVSASA